MPNRPEQLSPAALGPHTPRDPVLVAAGPGPPRREPAPSSRPSWAWPSRSSPSCRSRHRHAGRLLPHVRPAVRPVVPRVGLRRAARQRRRCPRRPRRRRDRRGRPGGSGPAAARRGPGHPGRGPTPASRHDRARAVVGVVWALLAVLGTTTGANLRVASAQTSTVAVDHVGNLRQGIADRRGVRAARRERPVRGDLPAEPPRRPAGQGRARRLRRELRPGRPGGPAPRAHGDRSGRPRHGRARRRGVLRPQRLPHLADVRRPQLAGALHAPDRPPDHRPGPLQRRPRHPAADPGLGVRVGRLAHRPRQPGRRDRHLAGHRVLRVRRPLRRPGPRLPRTEVRVCAGAGPVHPRHPRAARSSRPGLGHR